MGRWGHSSLEESPSILSPKALEAGLELLVVAGTIHSWNLQSSPEFWLVPRPLPSPLPCFREQKNPWGLRRICSCALAGFYFTPLAWLSDGLCATLSPSRSVYLPLGPRPFLPHSPLYSAALQLCVCKRVSAGSQKRPVMLCKETRGSLAVPPPPPSRSL